MSYFPDLTPYTYDKNNENGNAVNVGWLSPLTHPFATGDVPPVFVELLKGLPVGNHYRGWHTCGLCTASGNGDVRVSAEDGRVYVAPALIAHYVEVHSYVPPLEFIHAVMDRPRWAIWAPNFAVRVTE